jgi:hypothetical protein
MACFHACLSMTDTAINHSRGFYFALPRLLVSFLGERPLRCENNFGEALFAGAMAVFLPWLALLELTGTLECSLGWVSAIVLLAAVTPLWLIVFYLNSLLIGLFRKGRLMRNYTNRTIQGAAALIIVALSSVCIAFSHSAIRWIGLAMLTLIALDLFAAVALPLANDPPSSLVKE